MVANFGTIFQVTKMQKPKVECFQLTQTYLKLSENCFYEAVQYLILRWKFSIETFCMFLDI